MCDDKKIKTLRIDVSNLWGCVTRLEKVVKEMADFGVETLDEVKESLIEARASAKLKDDTLKATINKCDHDWIRYGHTFNKDRFKCIKCGEIKFE